MTPVCPTAFLPSGVGTWELALIFIVILILFGPRRLPEIARSIGRVLQELRRASQDFRDQVMRIEDDVREAARDALDPQDSDEDTAPPVTIRSGMAAGDEGEAPGSEGEEGSPDDLAG